MTQNMFCSDRPVPDSALALHFKYNGPLHKEMALLMQPKEAGGRFVSFPWLVHDTIFRADREHAKFDSMLRKHAKQPQSTPKPVGHYFYSESARTQFRLDRQRDDAAKREDAAKKRLDAKERKAKERTKKKAKAPAKGGKAQHKATKRTDARASFSADDLEDDEGLEEPGDEDDEEEDKEEEVKKKMKKKARRPRRRKKKSLCAK